MNRATFRQYAFNSNTIPLCYEYYKAVFYWLWVIEYANFNSQDTYKEELTEELQKISSIYQKLNSVFRDFMAPLEITEDKPKKKDKKENKPLDTSDDDLKILGYMTIPLDTPPKKSEKEAIIDINI